MSNVIEYQIQFPNDNQVKLSGRVESLGIGFVCSLDDGDSLWLRAESFVISVFAGLIARAIEEMLVAIGERDFQKTNRMLETIVSVAEAGNEAQSRVREEMQRRGKRAGVVYDFKRISLLAQMNLRVLSDSKMLPPAACWRERLFCYREVERLYRRIAPEESGYWLGALTSPTSCTAASGR